MRRHDDASDRMEIAASVATRQPAAAKPQSGRTLRCRRHRQRHRAIGRVDAHVGAEDGLPGPKREIHLEVVAGHAVTRVRQQPNVQVHVAGRSAVEPGAALAGQAQCGAVAHAARNGDVEAAAVQCDATLPTVQDIVERQGQLPLDVVARHRHSDATPARSAPAVRGPAEDRGEEVAEVAAVTDVVPVTGRHRWAAASARWRREIHAALVVAAERVVFGALVRVAEHLVGLVDLLEPFSGLRALRRGLQIRMVLARELPVGSLDVVCACRAGRAEDLVVVAELYGHWSAGLSSASSRVLVSLMAHAFADHDAFRSSASRNSASMTSSSWGPPEGCPPAPVCAPAPRDAASASDCEARVRLSWARRMRSTSSLFTASRASFSATSMVRRSLSESLSPCSRSARSVAYTSPSVWLRISISCLRCASSLAWASASRTIRSTSCLLRPDEAVMVICCCLPLAVSFAETLRMPLASMSNATSIWGMPRGAGGMPSRRKRPSVRLSRASGRSPWSTWTSTAVWLSAAVVKISLLRVGMVVLRGISTVMEPPCVSTPSESGVTSRSTTSLTSPARTPAWIAAPTATTSSGLTPLCASLPNSCVTSCCAFGIRV